MKQVMFQQTRRRLLQILLALQIRLPILGMVTEKSSAASQQARTPSDALAAATIPGDKHPEAKEETSTGLHITGLSTLSAAVRASLTLDLIDDPQLIPEKLKVLQDNLKSCYKFATVCIPIEYFWSCSSN